MYLKGINFENKFKPIAESAKCSGKMLNYLNSSRAKPFT